MGKTVRMSSCAESRRTSGRASSQRPELKHPRRTLHIYGHKRTNSRLRTLRNGGRIYGVKPNQDR